MKPHARPTLVFDDSCPMCKVYTGAFGALGWSERTPFSSAIHDLGDVLDLDRARHEIPMVETAVGTGTVTVRYGLDGLSTLLAAKLPWLAWWFRHPLVLQHGQPVYDFISYNRREIAGAAPPVDGFDCAPDHHPEWMLRYQLAAGAASAALAVGSFATLAAVSATAGVAAAALGVFDAEATDKRRRTSRSHAVTSALVAAGAARLVGAFVPRSDVVALAGITAGAQQVYRRVRCLNA